MVTGGIKETQLSVWFSRGKFPFYICKYSSETKILQGNQSFCFWGVKTLDFQANNPFKCALLQMAAVCPGPSLLHFIHVGPRQATTFFDTCVDLKGYVISSRKNGRPTIVTVIFSDRWKLTVRPEETVLGLF